ncbi:hypothetical protein T07_7032 [Trichinella nelsoni]|uniref:Uncharacterized protein n=1 Tax=Trichinella nelsoni TaxID=6336 RepID=A0A0V0S0X8_9BILA|nr:hypothetical protein T07_7032 [Trichinella nelsoni]
MVTIKKDGFCLCNGWRSEATSTDEPGGQEKPDWLGGQQRDERGSDEEVHLRKSMTRWQFVEIKASENDQNSQCRAILIPISEQLLQTNAIDIARKMGIKQWLAGIIYASPYNIKFCMIFEETADQILIEELLSKSNVNKDVLSEKVEDPFKLKLTYSKAITIKDIRFKSTLI